VNQPSHLSSVLLRRKYQSSRRKSLVHLLCQVNIRLSLMSCVVVALLAQYAAPPSYTHEVDIGNQILPELRSFKLFGVSSYPIWYLVFCANMHVV
jgi:hypothetical protein